MLEFALLSDSWEKEFAYCLILQFCYTVPYEEKMIPTGANVCYCVGLPLSCHFFCGHVY